MNNTHILLNVIDNIKSGNFEAVEADCLLLPKTVGKHIVAALYACGEKSAIMVADKYLGNI